MKTVFLIIVIVHGIIHLLGFIKGFNIKQINELTLTVSKPQGIIWMISMVLFLVFGYIFLVQNRYAWLVGFVAILLSQILIIMFWKDAKFGTIVNVIVLLVSFVGLGSYLLHNEFSSRVKSDFIVNNSLSTDILTEKDIEHLPLIVQKYMHYTKSVGQPKVKNFRADFTGGMRSTPEDEYMKLKSIQYNFLQEPSRYFYMTANKIGLPATGLHLYQNQLATFEVNLLNWFKVVNAKGEKMNQAETVTLLNDICIIAPPALIDKRISWEEIDSTNVRATFTNKHICVSAILYFNEKGELVNFLSKDRYETDGKKYENNPWSTPVENYKMINGYLLPGKGKLIFHRPEGDFMYGEIDIISVDYNCSAF